MPGHRMAVPDPAREERARRARALGCDASKGQHIEAQGEFHLRRRIQILEEQVQLRDEEIAVLGEMVVTQRDVIAEQELALVRERSQRRFPVEPIGATAEPGW